MKNTILLPHLKGGGALFSATRGREAALSLATGAPSRAHAGFGGHATTRRRSPSITHHPASHDASWTSGTPIVAPHVPTFVSPTGLSFTHCSRLLLLHVQTHLASKHDGLQGKLRRARSVSLCSSPRLFKHYSPGLFQSGGSSPEWKDTGEIDIAANLKSVFLRFILTNSLTNKTPLLPATV